MRAGCGSWSQISSGAAASTVFLSYAAEDRQPALEVRALLAERYTVFMNASSLVVGSQWLREIEAALQTCCLVTAAWGRINASIMSYYSRVSTTSR